MTSIQQQYIVTVVCGVGINILIQQYERHGPISESSYKQYEYCTQSMLSNFRR